MRKKLLRERIRGPALEIRVSPETYEMIRRAGNLLKRRMNVDGVSMHYTVRYAVKRLIEELAGGYEP